MAPSLDPPGGGRLERLCTAGQGKRRDWSRAQGPVEGVELFQAWFTGRGFDRHRHDTYGICVTGAGVQTFDYRGKVERSLRGQVTVLHPDEPHDGRAGTEGGFGYRIVYVEPARIAGAARALRGRPTPLPFVREAVSDCLALARAVHAAFQSGLEPLALDALVLGLAEGLLQGDPSIPSTAPSPRLDEAALKRGRDFLDSRRDVVRSAELAAVTGMTRYELARQFRAVYGTSPYRYSLMRRLDFARRGLCDGVPLAALALEAGFADQAHFTRTFRATYGLTPGRYVTLHRTGTSEVAR